MEISNTHQHLSNRLKNPEVLTNPEPFLGPNWETVLRWWLYKESLTDDQVNELERRWDAFDYDTRRRAWDLTHAAAIEVIGVDNWLAVLFVAPYPEALTVEIISMHLLLKRGHCLTEFVPLLKDL